MRHEREIHNFLHGTGGEHGKTRLTARHHVLMIAENVQGVRRARARADVKHGGHEFARDLIHIGDHQKKTLAGGIRRGERARAERTVHGARGAAFGLHFGKFEFLAEHVHASGSRPFVRHFRHGGRRGNGVNGRNLRECVGDVAGGGIAVDRHLFHKKI